MTDARRIAPAKLPQSAVDGTKAATDTATPKLRQRASSTPSPASLGRGATVRKLTQPFDPADIRSARPVTGLEPEPLSASQTAVTPRWAQIAETLAQAHAVRGQEIMDSLPPDYVAGLLRRGETLESLVARLAACGHLLHVSETSFKKGVGRGALLKDPVKGLGKGIRGGGGRALSSAQAALVRRTVAMLALAGAGPSDIEAVRDALVAGMGVVNGRAGDGRRQDTDALPQECDSLASYPGQIDPTPADTSFADRQRPLPLIGLHAAMSNVLDVLETGGSAAEALEGLRRDLDGAAADRLVEDALTC